MNLQDKKRYVLIVKERILRVQGMEKILTNGIFEVLSETSDLYVINIGTEFIRRTTVNKGKCIISESIDYLERIKYLS